MPLAKIKFFYDISIKNAALLSAPLSVPDAGFYSMWLSECCQNANVAFVFCILPPPLFFFFFFGAERFHASRPRHFDHVVNVILFMARSLLKLIVLSCNTRLLPLNGPKTPHHVGTSQNIIFVVKRAFTLCCSLSVWLYGCSIFSWWIMHWTTRPQWKFIGGILFFFFAVSLRCPAQIHPLLLYVWHCFGTHL